MDANNCANSACLGDCKADSKTAIKDDGDEHLRKIFVGGLSTQTTMDTLREFFSQFGSVADAVVMRDPVSNHSRGFGFVTYVDPKSIEIVQRARPHTIDNKAVETKPALPRNEFKRGGGVGSILGGCSVGAGYVKSNKIFLGGLKDFHDEKSVREYFSQFGVVATVKLLMDKDTGRKRGFGFLEFEDPSSAEKALAQGKHSILQSVVEVKRSTQKPDPGKRLRFPVSSSIRDGYIPPQPPTLDSYNYNNANYNPYLAQYVLPPSAFTHGWAHYVTPLALKPSTGQYMTEPQSQPVPPDMWSSYPKPGTYAAQEWTPSKVVEKPPKAGHKHAQTSTSDRPKNDFKVVQPTPLNDNQDLGARGDADGKSGVGLGLGLRGGAAVGVGAIKKWPTGAFKIFIPGQSSTNGVIPKTANGASPPAYVTGNGTK